MDKAREKNHRPTRAVLVIDDNVDLAISLAHLLQFYDCRVDVAHDGREGLRLALQRRYDVVFIDIGLPVMSGYEVARVIRSAQDNPPLLLAQTAYGQPEDVHMSREAGFDAHLIKPVDPGELIRHVLEGRDALSEERGRKAGGGGGAGPMVRSARGSPSGSSSGSTPKHELARPNVDCFPTAS